MAVPHFSFFPMVPTWFRWRLLNWSVSPDLHPPTSPLQWGFSLMESWFQVIVHPFSTRNAPEGSCHLQTNFPFSPCHSEILGILPCGFLRFKFNHPSCPRVCKKKKSFALATLDFGYCESHIHLMTLFINWWDSILLRLKPKYALSWRLPIAQPHPVASKIAEKGWILFAFIAFSLFLYYTGLCESRNGDLTVCLFPTYILKWFVYGRDLLGPK